MSQNLILIVLAALLATAGLACQAQEEASPQAPEAITTQEKSVKPAKAGAPGKAKVEVLRFQRSSSKMAAWGSYEEGKKGLTFSNFDASAKMEGGEVKELTFSFDLSSATSEDKELAGKLLSDYFFDASKTKRPSFRMTSGDSKDPKAAGGSMLTGELTLRGQTNVVSFPLDVEKGDKGTILKATFPIPRGDFGIPDPGAESPEISSKHPDIYLSMELSFPQGS